MLRYWICFIIDNLTWQCICLRRSTFRVRKRQIRVIIIWWTLCNYSNSRWRCLPIHRCSRLWCRWWCPWWTCNSKWWRIFVTLTLKCLNSIIITLNLFSIISLSLVNNTQSYNNNNNNYNNNHLLPLNFPQIIKLHNS